VAASCSVVFGLSGRDARGQSGPVETYYVNDGVNNLYDNQFGEFSNDLLGWVPWSRYGDTSSHYFARGWNATAAGRSFQEMMYDGAFDLDYLVQQINAYCSLSGVPPPNNTIPAMLPFPNGHVSVDSGLPSFPVVDDAWWTATGGTGSRKVLYWPYRIDGGFMMICTAGTPANQPGVYQPDVSSSASIMLFNYHEHRSAFGTNKNCWHDTVDGRKRQFSQREAVWDGVSAGLQILGPTEQAIEAGDVVVFVGENYGQDFWTSLTRTQEAEWFVRHQFSQAPPNGTSGNTFQPITIDRSFLCGGSWGEIVSGVLATL
jgi:hypothetical protein